MCVKFFYIMKIIGKGILLVIGIVFSATLGYSGSEEMLKYSQRIPDEKWRNVAKLIPGINLESMSMDQIKEIIEKRLAINPDDIREINHDSIMNALKLYSEESVKAGGDIENTPWGIIRRLEAMPREIFIKELFSWGRQKAEDSGLLLDDAHNFVHMLRTLEETEAGTITLKFVMGFEKAYDDCVLMLQKVTKEQSYFSFSPSTGSEPSKAIIRLDFSRYSNRGIRRLYRQLNNYIYACLGISMPDEIVGDFSMPFAELFTGVCCGRYADQIKDKWGSFDELWSSTGFGIVKHPETGKNIMYINHFSDFNLYTKSLIWGNILMQQQPKSWVRRQDELGHSLPARAFLCLQNLNRVTEIKTIDILPERGPGSLSWSLSLFDEQWKQKRGDDFFAYTESVPDETWKWVAQLIPGINPDDMSIDQIKEIIKGKFGIDPDNVYRITYESITAVLKTCCDQRTKDIIKHFESMPYAGCCEEAERWVDSKGLPPQDADRLKAALRKLMEYPNGVKSFKLVFLLEQFFYGGKIILQKRERGLCSLFYSGPEGCIPAGAAVYLPFSPYLYTDVQVIYQQFNRYILKVLDIHVELEMIGDFLLFDPDGFGGKDKRERSVKSEMIGKFSIPFDPNGFGGEDRRERSVKSEMIGKFSIPFAQNVFGNVDRMGREWGSSYALWEIAGFGIVKHPKMDKDIICLSSFNDFGLCCNTIVWGDKYRRPSSIVSSEPLHDSLDFQIFLSLCTQRLQKNVKRKTLEEYREIIAQGGEIEELFNREALKHDFEDGCTTQVESNSKPLANEATKRPLTDKVEPMKLKMKKY